MAMIERLLACLICAGALLISPLSLRAEERINDYRVNIEVGEDGVLDITEHILITSAGDSIKRGIMREIPLAFLAADGHRARSFLTVLDIERDGEPEHYAIYETNRGAVIRIGSVNVELPPDEYLYTIRYHINRVINYADEYDQLIWNVNGIEGRLQIDELSVRLALPEGTVPLAVRAVTGYAGDDGEDVIVQQFGDVLTFEATRPYAAGENMTIELLLPKGAIQAPDEATLQEWAYYDYESTVFAVISVVCCALLAFFLWLLLGRDPRPGVIVPRWDPPSGMSPAGVNYSVSRNFDSGFWTAFAASMVDLAVKGKVVLEDLADGIAVRKLSDEEDPRLPTEQAAMMRLLPPAGERFRFDGESATKTSELGTALSDAVTTQIGRQFYSSRPRVWISFGLLVFLALLVHEISFTVGVEYVDGWLPVHWFAALVAWFFVMVAVQKYRKRAYLPRRVSLKERVSILLSLSSAAAIVWFFACVVYADAPVPRDGFLLTFSLLTIITLLWAFIGRLSRKGREVMDGIDGLRLYLELAEKERMALVGAPTMSPAHYETLLPYAVALGLEQAWSKHFETVLAQASATDTAGSYQPPWYGGSNTGGLKRIADIGEFSSGIASRIEQSLPSENDAYGSGSSGSSGSGRGGGGVSGW